MSQTVDVSRISSRPALVRPRKAAPSALGALQRLVGDDVVAFDAGTLTPDAPLMRIPAVMGQAKAALHLRRLGQPASVQPMAGRPVLVAAHQSAYVSASALLPPAQPFTFLASYLVPGPDRKALLYQQRVDAPGRLQLWANAAWNGTALVAAPGKLALFIGGMSVQLKAADMQPGVPFSVMVVIDTQRHVQWHVDGKLVDVQPGVPALVDTPTSLFGSSGADSAQVIFGRALMAPRVLGADAIAQAHAWVAAALAKVIVPPMHTPRVLTAASAIAVSVPRGQPPTATLDVRYALSPDMPVAPASTVKLLTALVLCRWADAARPGAADAYLRESRVAVIADDATRGSGNNLLAGDEVSLYDLLANMLIPSSNVSAAVVARVVGHAMLAAEGRPARVAHVAVARFIDAMNATAQRLGMQDSLFLNAHGLGGARQRSSARDLARLGIACLAEPTVCQVWGLPTYALAVNRAGTSLSIPIVSSVRMAGEPDVIGGKTGFLAGVTANLVVATRTPDDSTLITVVMRSATMADRFTDSRLVIDKALAAGAPA